MPDLGLDIHIFAYLAIIHMCTSIEFEYEIFLLSLHVIRSKL